MNTTEKITFKAIDAPTGAGKTTAIIKMINAAPPAADTFNRFLVLTPLLSEVERICKATTCMPPLENKRKHTSKLHALKQLIINGDNICCTHALSVLFDNEVKDLLQSGDYHYTLIIDEEPEVIFDAIDYEQPKGNTKSANKNLQEVYKLNKQDYKMLRERGFLLIDEPTGRLYWNDELEYNSTGRRGVFEGVRKALDSLDRFSFNKDERVIMVVNPSIWACFDEVYISTYRLHNSLFDYYCQLYGFSIEYYHINNGGEIAAGFVSEYPKGLERLVICNDEKYNLIGKKISDKEYRLSLNWFEKNCKKNSPAARELHNALRGFLRYGVPKGELTGYYWTTFKAFKGCLTGREVSPKHWIAHNTRATNDYSNCNTVAFVCDKFPNPNIERFLNSKGITVDKNEYALSCLIQFVWRSCIRTACANKVYVYVPARRLRLQFKAWLSTGIGTQKIDTQKREK